MTPLQASRKADTADAALEKARAIVLELLIENPADKPLSVALKEIARTRLALEKYRVVSKRTTDGTGAHGDG